MEERQSDALKSLPPCRSKTPMSNQPEQVIAELTDEDREELTRQRLVIEKFIANEESRQKYQTPIGKVGLIRAILKARVFRSDQTKELQCLGVILADAFVQHFRMEWIVVTDKYGRDFGVRLPGTSIIIYPLTMILKRMTDGQNVDAFDLFDAVAAKIRELQEQGV